MRSCHLGPVSIDVYDLWEVDFIATGQVYLVYAYCKSDMPIQNDSPLTSDRMLSIHRSLQKAQKYHVHHTTFLERLDSKYKQVKCQYGGVCCVLYVLLRTYSFVA